MPKYMCAVGFEPTAFRISRPDEPKSTVPFSFATVQPSNLLTLRHPIDINAPIAQSAERAAVNRKVVGSIPTWGAAFFFSSGQEVHTVVHTAHTHTAQSATWSSGMTPAYGAGVPGFNSRSGLSLLSCFFLFKSDSPPSPVPVIGESCPVIASRNSFPLTMYVHHFAKTDKAQPFLPRPPHYCALDGVANICSGGRVVSVIFPGPWAWAIHRFQKAQHERQV